MSLPREMGRILRLRKWIPILTLLPAAGLVFLGQRSAAAGLAAGGVIVWLNLLGTQRTAQQFIEGEGLERLLAAVVWFSKFGVTAAAVLTLLHMELVAPLALLVGLGTLPVSIVFDIFLFPVNKGEAKTP